DRSSRNGFLSIVTRAIWMRSSAHPSIWIALFAPTSSSAGWSTDPKGSAASLGGFGKGGGSVAGKTARRMLRGIRRISRKIFSPSVRLTGLGDAGEGFSDGGSGGTGPSVEFGDRSAVPSKDWPLKKS